MRGFKWWNHITIGKKTEIVWSSQKDPNQQKLQVYTVGFSGHVPGHPKYRYIINPGLHGVHDQATTGSTLPQNTNLCEQPSTDTQPRQTNCVLLD